MTRDPLPPPRVAAGVAALLGVVWLSALGPWRRSARGRLQREIAGASVAELPGLLEPRWLLEGADVADALRLAQRFDEAVAVDWEFNFDEEPERLFAVAQSRLAVLASEVESYHNSSEALWRLDYLSVKAERKDHRESAAELSGTLRKLLRRAVKRRVDNDPPSIEAKLIEPGSFSMGSDPDGQAGQPVRLSSSFCIQVYEVTKSSVRSRGV